MRIEKTHPIAGNLIRKMLEKDPTKRISARDALGHDYFKDQQEMGEQKSSEVQQGQESSSHANMNTNTSGSLQPVQPKSADVKKTQFQKQKMAADNKPKLWNTENFDKTMNSINVKQQQKIMAGREWVVE